MQKNPYNWYARDSYKRHQISLGHPDDPENVKMQEEVLASATPEELALWEAFSKEQREKSFFNRRRMGLPNEEVEERFRTFPKKEHNWGREFNADHQGASYASQTRAEYRSRYVLNRKVTPRPTMPSTSTSTPPLPQTQSDKIFIDDSAPTGSSNTRMIVSGDQASEARVTRHPRINAPMSPREAVESPPVVEETATSIRECTLHKYGHCPDITVCPHLHDGKATKVSHKRIKTVDWPKKLPSVAICPGYLNLSCWETNCKLRHVVYPSDNL